MRVAITRDERYPTLHLDDAQWREPPVFYPGEHVVDVPWWLIKLHVFAHWLLRRAENRLDKLPDSL